MATQKKIETVESLKAKLSAARGIYLADFNGMTVAQATELRNRCRKAGVEFEVVKNTLTRRALGEPVATQLESYLHGPTAIATSPGDEIAAAKIIADFLKQFEKPKIKAGIVEGRVITGDQVKELAQLPGKNVLIARFLGGLKSPVQKLHSALSSPLRNLASALKQVADKQVADKQVSQ